MSLYLFILSPSTSVCPRCSAFPGFRSGELNRAARTALQRVRETMRMRFHWRSSHMPGFSAGARAILHPARGAARQVRRLPCLLRSCAAGSLCSQCSAALLPYARVIPHLLRRSVMARTTGSLPAAPHHVLHALTLTHALSFLVAVVRHGFAPLLFASSPMKQEKRRWQENEKTERKFCCSICSSLSSVLFLVSALST